MFHKSSGIIFFTLFMTSARMMAANDSAVAFIKSAALSQAGFEAFCQSQKYDSTQITLALKGGIYVPGSQNCGGDIAVYPALKFDFGQIKKSLQQNSCLNSLLAYTASLYKLIAEPISMANTSRNRKSIDYLNHDLSCESLFDSLATGAWAFDCGGQAAIAKIFLDSLGNGKYISKTAQLVRNNGDEIDHIVTLVYYRENNQWYGVAIDCQNGKLGPLKAGEGKILSISEQKAALKLNPADSLDIISIPENDLHMKRNLVNSAFYCNVLPDNSCVYHLAYTQSGFQYERLTYSALHYTWFKAGMLNLKKYKQNLLALLIKYAPEN